MRKTLYTLFTAIAIVCMAFGVMLITNVNVAKVVATPGTTPTLSSTKYLKSTDETMMIVATGINNYQDCYELGYEIEGAEAVTYDTAKYYTSISLNGGANVWEAGELFPGYTGMIVWEIRVTSPDVSFRAKVRVGNREGGILVESETVAYGTAKEVDIDSYAPYTRTLYVEDGEDFVILNLTDFQLHDGKSTYTSFSIIDELVETTHPDLITVLGDTAEDNGTYTTTANFTAIVNHIDALGIPWAPIYGNHDNDNYREQNSIKDVTSTWINNTFTSAENCLFNVGPADVNGNGNYIVKVVNSSTGEIVKSLIFLDSGTSGVDSTHVTFYENAIGYCEDVNGGDTPESIVFLHIPLPEYRTLYDNDDYAGIAGEVPHAHGTTDFFAKIKELGSTTHVICGHDHENSFYGEYQGVYLMYCIKSSDGDYFDNLQLGGTTFTIGDTTTFDYHYLNPCFEIISKQTFNVPTVENFSSSNKAFTFDYKAVDNAINDGNDIGFTFWEGDNGWGKRVTRLITVNVVANTISGGIGTITDIGDGWYRVIIDCSNMPINTSEGADGTETVRMLYFNTVEHAFRLDNLDFVGKYNVTVVGGTGGGEYAKGESVTVTANVPYGKEFVKWTAGGEDVSTDNPYTFTLRGDVTLTAVLEDGETKVMLDTGFDINLPDYDENEALTLEFNVYMASGSTKFRFKLFDEDDNWVGTYYLYGNGTFYTAGGWNSAGVTCESVGNKTYHFTMTLEDLEGGSNDAPGKFVRLADNGSSDNLSDCWVDNIIFKGSERYTVTVVGGTGGGEYAPSESATITASVPYGEAFVKWTVGGEEVSTDNPYTFTVTGDVTLTAVFEDGETKVMLDTGFNIMLPDYDENNATTLEFDVYVTSARSPYTKIYWNLYDASDNYFGYYRITYGGIQATNTSGYSKTNLVTDTYHITFVLSELAGGSGTPGKLVRLADNGQSVNLDGAWIDNIVFKGSETYTVTVVGGTGGGDYTQGDRITVRANEPYGKQFVKWTAGGEDVSTRNPYVFIVTDDVTLTAVFEDGETKVMLDTGFNIMLPDYDENNATTLEFDVYVTSARSPYTKIYWNLYDASDNYFGYYRITYGGIQATNTSGYSKTNLVTDTYHVTFVLSELAGGSGTPGKLVRLADSGSSVNLDGAWIDNIEFH